MTTREELEAMKIVEMVERFGIPKPPPFTKKSDVIDTVLAWEDPTVQVRMDDLPPLLTSLTAILGACTVIFVDAGGNEHTLWNGREHTLRISGFPESSTGWPMEWGDFGSHLTWELDGFVIGTGRLWHYAERKA